MLANTQTCSVTDNSQVKRSNVIDLVEILTINVDTNNNNDIKLQ